MAALTSALAGGVVLHPQHPDATRLRAAATLPNPAARKHAELVARGRIPARSQAPPPRVAAWYALDAGAWRGGTVLPRYAPALPDAPVDRRSEGCAVAWAPSVRLRDYQSAAVEALIEAPDQSGVVVAPCGAGKTTLGIAAAARLGRSTLVLVHTLDLAEQWRQRLRSDAGVDAGLVGDGARSDDPVVVATMQTLATWDWSDLQVWGRGYGTVIVDECHHSPCDSLVYVLGALPGRWRLGLTATPDRADGLTPIMEWTLGSTAHRIQYEGLFEAGVVMRPHVEVLRTGWEPADSAQGSWAESMAALVEDDARNNLIDATIRRLVADGRRVLVLSERVAHCREIARRHGGAALVGSLSSSGRASVLDAARAGTLRVVAGTTVADEGLDVPGLDAVVLASPSRQAGRIEQRIGRVMRSAPGKSDCIVVDLVDSWGPLRAQAAARRAVYSRLGASVR